MRGKSSSSSPSGNATPEVFPGLRPRIKFWMQTEGGFGFGSRFIAILQAVERTGSIKSAAKELGWSYRHTWDRIKEAEQALGRPLVLSRVGGNRQDRTELTEAGRHLVGQFLELRARLLALAVQDTAFLEP